MQRARVGGDLVDVHGGGVAGEGKSPEHEGADAQRGEDRAELFACTDEDREGDHVGRGQQVLENSVVGDTGVAGPVHAEQHPNPEGRGGDDEPVESQVQTASLEHVIQDDRDRHHAGNPADPQARPE